MKHLIRLAVVAMVLAAPSVIAADGDNLREAIEIASAIEPNSQSMMGKVPRTCRLLRRAAKEAQGTADAERIDQAHGHCRRALEALTNGNPGHAAHRLRLMLDAITE